MMWPFHRHDFSDHVRSELDGATLGWGGAIQPCYSITRRCRCGKEQTTHGWLLPLMKEPPRDKDGWPLHDGKRMRIAVRGKAA